MSRVTRLEYLTPASATPADAATTSAQNAPVVAPPSPTCLAILHARLPLEKRVAYARDQIRFYETCSGEFAARELAFNRTLLTDAVADLATFDLTRLTDECRQRLTAFGVAFTQPMQAAAE